MGTPILAYQPGGGTPIFTPLPPPLGHVAGENGIAPLIEDQSYVDVVFPIIQPRSDWTFIECRVLNTVDLTPLNIWPGIVTHKSRTGFTLQLNGLPDSGNYYLDWAISGATEGTAGVATSYLFSGPVSGPIGVPSTFVVALPAGTTLDDPVTITPDDGGAGGTFTPIVVELSAGVPTAYFTYIPVSYGSKIISVNDDAGMADPAMLNFVVVAATYSLTGPSSGATGAASTNFTVALPVGAVVTSTVTVIPNDSGSGGTFTPSSLALTTAAPSGTFTYTPSTQGVKTVGATNNRGLADPVQLAYTSIFNPGTITGLKGWWRADSMSLANGASVATWADSSVNANNATQATGSLQPTFQTSVLNGLPIIRFNSATQTVNKRFSLATLITGASPWTVIAVLKPASIFADCLSLADGVADAVRGPHYSPGLGGVVYVNPRGGLYHTTASGFGTAWHVYVGASDQSVYVDGTSYPTVFQSASPAGTGNFNTIGYENAGPFSDGDIAEILIYNVVLSTTDRQAIELYLRTKYATP